MMQENRVGVNNPDEGKNLRQEIDAMIPQLFPNPKSRNGLRFDRLGVDWKEQMRNVHQAYPSISSGSSLELYPRFFPAYKLWVSFGSLEVTLTYLKTGQTEAVKGYSEFRRDTGGYEWKTYSDKEEFREEIRLKMIKEVLAYALARRETARLVR